MGLMASLTFFLKTTTICDKCVGVSSPFGIKAIAAAAQIKLPQHHRESAGRTVQRLAVTDAFDTVSRRDNPLGGDQGPRTSSRRRSINRVKIQSHYPRILSVLGGEIESILIGLFLC